MPITTEDKGRSQVDHQVAKDGASGFSMTKTAVGGSFFFMIFRTYESFRPVVDQEHIRLRKRRRLVQLRCGKSAQGALRSQVVLFTA